MDEPTIWLLWDDKKVAPLSPVKAYIREEAAHAGAKANSFRHRPVSVVPLYRKPEDPRP